MVKANDETRSPKSRLSRRQMIKLAGGAAGFTFLQLKSKAAPIALIASSMLWLWNRSLIAIRACGCRF